MMVTSEITGPQSGTRRRYLPVALHRYHQPKDPRRLTDVAAQEVEPATRSRGECVTATTTSDLPRIGSTELAANDPTRAAIDLASSPGSDSWAGHHPMRPGNTTKSGRYGAPATEDATMATRLDGDWGHTQGTLPAA
jgi:hypothetical protein